MSSGGALERSFVANRKAKIEVLNRELLDLLRLVVTYDIVAVQCIYIIALYVGV